MIEMRENNMMEFFKGIFFGFLFALLLGLLAISLLHSSGERRRKQLSEERKMTRQLINSGTVTEGGFVTNEGLPR